MSPDSWKIFTSVVIYRWKLDENRGGDKMTNQEIALEITKILKPDIDHYTRHHNDGDRFETRKRVYAETYLYFLNKFNENDKAEGKTEEE